MLVVPPRISVRRDRESIEIDRTLSLKISIIIPVLNEQAVVSAAIERAWAVSYTHLTLPTTPYV